MASETLPHLSNKKKMLMVTSTRCLSMADSSFQDYQILLMALVILLLWQTQANKDKNSKLLALQKASLVHLVVSLML